MSREARKLSGREALDQLWRSGRVRVEQYEALKRSLDRLDELSAIAADLRQVHVGIVTLASEVQQLRLDVTARAAAPPASPTAVEITHGG